MAGFVIQGHIWSNMCDYLDVINYLWVFKQTSNSANVTNELNFILLNQKHMFYVTERMKS